MKFFRKWPKYYLTTEAQRAQRFSFFVCRETAANEKHQPWREKNKTVLQSSGVFTEDASIFCPSPSPDGQKEKDLCVLCGSVVKDAFQ